MSASVGADEQELDRWLMRHGTANAYDRWHSADPTGSSLLAFTAIAAEPRLLMRLSPNRAKALALDAIHAISQIDGTKSVSPAAAAASRAVKLRISHWRHYVAAMHATPEPETARTDAADAQTAVAPETRSAIENAIADFPQFRRANAKFLVDTVCKLGVKGLLAVGKPTDVVFALGAARVAARIHRGKLPGFSMPREKYMEALGIVQEWGQATGRKPFHVRGYAGRGTLEDRVLALARDANTCAELAVDLPGGITNPGFSQWEDAEEIHGYAILCLRNNPLGNMDYDLAIALVSAGGRLAERAMDDPAVLLPELPDLPSQVEDFSPKMVAIMARGFVQGALSPRRTEASRIEAGLNASSCLPKIV